MRPIRSMLFFLVAICAPAAVAQDDCKKCDCLHPPFKSECEKCCHIFEGKVVSVGKDHFVLRTKDASGKQIQKMFSLDDKTKTTGDLTPGSDVTVLSKKSGSKDLATDVKQKNGPIARNANPQ